MKKEDYHCQSCCDRGIHCGGECDENCVVPLSPSEEGLKQITLGVYPAYPCLFTLEKK